MAFKCRSCPNLAELVKQANSSAARGASTSNSGNSSSSNNSSSRAARRVRRQVSCSALLVPVDTPAFDMLDTARQSITHELVVQSALHVSAAQRFECLQRHHSGSADDSVALAMLTAPDLTHSSSSSSGSVVNITAAPVPEVAACYATPYEGVEEVRNVAEELALEEATRRLHVAATVASNRTVLAPRVTTAEAISASQRTAPALELLTAEVSEAMDAARRRRRHAAKRAMLNMMRGSKWLLEKVPIAAAAAVANQDTAVPSSG